MNESHPNPPNNAEIRPIQNVTFENNPRSRVRIDIDDERIILSGLCAYSDRHEKVGQLDLLYVHNTALEPLHPSVKSDLLMYVTIDGIVVYRSYASQGFGLGIYLSMIKELEKNYQVPLISSEARNLTGSPDSDEAGYGSYQVWESLVRRGLAHKVSSNQDTTGKTVGLVHFISIPTIVQKHPELITSLERYFSLVFHTSPTIEVIREIGSLRTQLFPTTTPPLLE